jgi:hypothetical protein
MSNSGHDFAATTRDEIGENKINHSSSDVSEGVPVEEEKGSAPVALPQKFYGFGEGVDLGLSFPPLCFKRSTAL